MSGTRAREVEMKLGVSRERLGEAVAFVSRALPSRPVIPMLSGMLLEASGASLTISCFDYEVSARVRLDAEVRAPGAALVPGRLLAEITRSLPARPVELSVEGEIVNLTCGGAEFGLVCLPAADYPVLPDGPSAVGTVDGGALAAAVTQVAPAASRDDTLPMLTAICLEISGSQLTLAATDRYRLATRRIEITRERSLPRSVALVPARIMIESARAMAQSMRVSIAFDDHDGGARPAGGMIGFATEDKRLTARLIAGEFINYESRFPPEFDHEAKLPAGPIIDAVRRAALVAERAGPVRLSFRPDEVTVEAHAEGRARAAERLTARFTGESAEIAFNLHYLLDGLAAAASAQAGPGRGEEPADPGSAAETGSVGTGGSGEGETGEGETSADEAATGRGLIRLEFTSPAKPALITWVGTDRDSSGSARSNDEAGFRYLLVPLRAPGRV